MHTRGVLLVQPEYLLSFELMTLERLPCVELELGNILGPDPRLKLAREQPPGYSRRKRRNFECVVRAYPHNNRLATRH